MPEQKRKNKGGRPSKCTPKLAKEICGRIAEGESLIRICKDEKMPNKSTVLRWAIAHKWFCDQYTQACELRHDVWAEEITDIADDATSDMTVTDKGIGVDYENIQRSKLRVDSRKWLLSKLKSKKYGDKVDVTTDGDKIQGAPVIIVSNQETKDELDKLSQ